MTTAIVLLIVFIITMVGLFFAGLPWADKWEIEG